MDRIRTLLLARSHVVVMDPDVIAGASTRPSRDVDVANLEDELAQLGFVMSLDLASTLRRLPFQAIQDLRAWIHGTLAAELGAQRPHVPLATVPATTGGDAPSHYVQRVVSWLRTSAEQPCPWCSERKPVGALDPCGHLVCRSCWADAGYSACPVCHRRVAQGDPFIRVAPAGERMDKHHGTLALVQLAFDLLGTAKQRFEQLLARATPLSSAERSEVELVIDVVGPKVASWLPARMPRPQTRAIAIARLWLIAPDRRAIARETAVHVRTATDVLRIAVVLMGGNAELVDPIRLASIARPLRRVVLETLEQLPLEEVVEDMMRRRALWKRAGERLHPYELADELPNVALAFAVVRRSDLGALSFGPAVRERAVRPSFVYVEDNVVKPIAWAGPIEDALRAGNPRAALARLTHRPNDLLRRADHLVRVAQLRQRDALQTLLKAVELAATKAPPSTMLTLAAHVARRARPWPRRVFVPDRDVLRAWTTHDDRPPLRGDVIAVMVGSIRRQLCNRAEPHRQFPRAVIDRALVDLLVPASDHKPARNKVSWSRGSELALPEGQRLRLLLHWEAPNHAHVDLDLSVVLYDAEWRHVATCDANNLVVAGRTEGTAATHSGDIDRAPPPRGPTELADLHFEQLAMLGARHAVMAVFSHNAARFDELSECFAGIALAPMAGAGFDPRAVAQRFDLRGRSFVTVPLTIDLAERRLRWLDVHIADRTALARAGGYRASLAHIGRDFADVIGVHARPTMWDVACVHAAARANVIYIRERDGSFTTYRRRDNETKVTRLGRLMSGAADDGRIAALPQTDAPTWFALVSGMPMPRGSVGYALDGRGLTSDGIERLSAWAVVDQLSVRAVTPPAGPAGAP